MLSTYRRVATQIAAAALIAAAVVLGFSLSGASQADAGSPPPGTNCASYTSNGTARTCVVDIGDNYYCDASFQGSLCETVVEAGDTIFWDFSGTSPYHTTTECGTSCDTPTDAPAFDSGLHLGGMYTFTTPFDVPQVYLYHCYVHPDLMLGRLVVQQNLPQPPIGDVNCDGRIDSIDAALVLQLSAGIVQSLPCQQNADANDDGTVNSIDAAVILQYAAGLLNELPP